MTTERFERSTFFTEEESGTSSSVGAKLPPITLTAIVTRTNVALQNIGKPAVLVFCTQETASTTEAIIHVIDSKYKLISDVFVAGIVDLRVVPKWFRFIAEAAMGTSYRDALGRVPKRLSDRECVFILPDWDGVVIDALGFQRVNQIAGIALLDETGTIVATYQQDDPGKHILAKLDDMMQQKM
jgi:hypothetical protein